VPRTTSVPPTSAGAKLGPAERPFREGLEGPVSGDRRLQVVLLDDFSLLHAQKGDEARPARKISPSSVSSPICGGVRSGRIEDTLLLDFRQLSKLRYLNLPSVLFPLFHGVFDQLALDPAAEP
jgi:hypothetical protein